MKAGDGVIRVSKPRHGMAFTLFNPAFKPLLLWCQDMLGEDSDLD
jgi:hypothetical protein